MLVMLMLSVLILFSSFSLQLWPVRVEHRRSTFLFFSLLILSCFIQFKDATQQSKVCTMSSGYSWFQVYPFGVTVSVS